MLSAVIQKPLPSNIAMTGKLLKNGDIFVVGIGGKIDAAAEFGFTRIMLPEMNKSDFREYKENNPDVDMTAYFPKTIWEAIDYVFPDLEKEYQIKPEVKRRRIK